MFALSYMCRRAGLLLAMPMASRASSFPSRLNSATSIASPASSATSLSPPPLAMVSWSRRLISFILFSIKFDHRPLCAIFLSLSVLTSLLLSLSVIDLLGRYMSHEAVKMMVHPGEEAIKAVSTWLDQHQVCASPSLFQCLHVRVSPS